MILTVKTTGKSRGKSATTHSIRHNSEKRILFFFCHVISRAFVRWRSVSDSNPKTVTRRPEEMPSVHQKPNFIIGQTQSCNLEFHCAIVPRWMISVARSRSLEQLIIIKTSDLFSFIYLFAFSLIYYQFAHSSRYGSVTSRNHRAYR